jgi:hypothetical protein
MFQILSQQDFQQYTSLEYSNLTKFNDVDSLTKISFLQFALTVQTKVG